MRLTAFADAAAPGVVIAQGIGRWGNWFNNELYGGPTSAAVAAADPRHRRRHRSFAHRRLGHAVVLGYFQPTFLYESIWDIALGLPLLYLVKRRTFGRGNVMALYVMGYTIGRAWIEALRHDHANHILGLRLNDWTAIIVFLGALVWYVIHRKDPDESIYRDGHHNGVTTSDEAEEVPS